MPPTLKASAQGLAKIKQARMEKGLTTNGTEACKQASLIINPKWKAGEPLADNVSVTSWKRFLKGTPAIRTEAFKAFCQILGLNYLEICKSSSLIYQITASAEADKIKPIAKDFIIRLQEISGDYTIECKEIREGSVIVVLQGSEEGFEKLQTLFKNGELTEILGFTIENVELESIELEDTKEWLESLFNEDWQPAETVLAASSIRSSAIDTESNAAKVAKAKIIDLSESQSVVILLQFTFISDEEVKASLGIYPTENNAYLPEGLVIRILDEQDTVSLDREVESYADSVQIEFSFEPQGQFKIELNLENTHVTENLFEN